ncbi:MAG TPA: hypothetical protein PK443_01430 [bacterium]|nr:hypothetical protein [bacterium]
MLRNIFVSFVFLFASALFASHEIGDVLDYIMDLESKIHCDGTPTKNEIISDSEGRDVKVTYFCKDGMPELQQASIVNNKGLLETEINRVNFVGDVFAVREKYFTFHDNGSTKTTTEYFVEYNPKENTSRSIYTNNDEYSEDKRLKRSVNIQSGTTTEESWDYFPNGARSKYTVVITTDKDKSESIIDYNQSGEKIRDTEIYYDLTESTPYKKEITAYDLKSQKIVEVVIYEYENGIERFKTTDEYERGKLLSRTYYELIYDEQGKFKKEKKTGKDIF